jgi:hypothetical protein
MIAALIAGLRLSAAVLVLAIKQDRMGIGNVATAVSDGSISYCTNSRST